MEKEYYYVYCQGILGVKTNIRDFKWIYGSVAPSVSSEEYEKCVVKFDVCIKPEKYLSKNNICDRKFQAYTWNRKSQMLSCYRKFFMNFEIGYHLQIRENTVYAEIGIHYYKFVKNRTMNLHGVYYLLSDLANVILLKNGFLTLYASAVCFGPLKRCIVNFAPPNTGKTYMATKLCEKSDYQLVGEDIVIFDGYKVHSCPWTNSYRKASKLIFDSSGSLGRSKKKTQTTITEECILTDVMVLSLGEERVCTDKDQIFRYISMLNGYLYNYYSSPIIKILGYFDEKYDKSWTTYAETFLKNMVNSCRCCELQTEESGDFAGIFHEIISGEKL